MVIPESKSCPLNEDRVEMAKSLFGLLPADITLEDARKERLEQIEGMQK